MKGQMQSKKARPLKVLFGLMMLGGSVWFFLGGGLEQQASKDMSRIENDVAADAVKQYQIAKRSGTSMDACVHAGFVTAAYIQAKDESNYQRWKEVEKADCRLAGVDEH